MPLRKGPFSCPSQRRTSFRTPLYLLALPHARRGRGFGGYSRPGHFGGRGPTLGLSVQHHDRAALFLLPLRRLHPPSTPLEPERVWRQRRLSRGAEPVRFRDGSGHGRQASSFRWKIVRHCRLFEIQPNPLTSPLISPLTQPVKAAAPAAPSFPD